MRAGRRTEIRRSCTTGPVTRPSARAAIGPRIRSPVAIGGRSAPGAPRARRVRRGMAPGSTVLWGGPMTVRAVAVRGWSGERRGGRGLFAGPADLLGVECRASLMVERAGRARVGQRGAVLGRKCVGGSGGGIGGSRLFSRRPGRLRGPFERSWPPPGVPVRCHESSCARAHEYGAMRCARLRTVRNDAEAGTGQGGANRKRRGEASGSVRELSGLLVPGPAGARLRSVGQQLFRTDCSALFSAESTVRS